jgi:fatty-acyl-CoA synthase
LRLPAYARPLFLRIQGSIATTATFKHQKSDLIRQGFDPASTTDAIYLNEASQRTYIALDSAVFRRIQDGTIRL